MCAEGLPLTGVLYGGLMKTAQGVKVIEFNARFGDPETEVVLPLLESDAYDVFYGIATGLGLPSCESGISPFSWRKEATIGVVLASKGYPGDYAKGAVVEGVAREIFPNPFFLMEKLSLLTMRSSPRKNLIRGFLIRATGMREEAFRPMSPSESQSTERPVTKAINMHRGVLTVRGTHIIIAGSMDSMT